MGTHSGKKRGIKIISNLPGLETAQSERCRLEHYSCASGCDTVGAVLALFLRSFRYDYVLLNGSGSLIFKLALLKWLIPFHRTKLVVLDILLSTPVSARDRLKVRIVKVLLKKVHLLLLYYKNTEGLQKVYAIPASRFRYVPFKINRPELVGTSVPTDGGYIFCGGKTRRDFATLFEAVKDTDLPVKVVTTDNRDIRQHGSFLDAAAAPANVEVIILDGNAEQFIAHLASARLVAMPIIPDICGAGIGVYIMAMALRKCVVISEIPGTSDTLPPGTAVVVPPENPMALREALSRAFHDDAYRRRFETAGQEYALQLGGEEQLLQSVVAVLCDDLDSRQQSCSPTSKQG